MRSLNSPFCITAVLMMLAVVSARSEDIQIQPVPLENALRASPELLGEGYLWVVGQIELASFAQLGATLQLVIDGRPTTVTRDNVTQFLKAMEDRKKTYATAIRRRGFEQLGSFYDAVVTPGCESLNIADVPTLLEQDGFELTVAQGPLKHRGVVIESSVIVIHAESFEILLHGRREGEKLTLRVKPRGTLVGVVQEPCEWTLRENQSPGKDFANAYVGRALAWFGEDRFDRVKPDLDAALRLDPNSIGAHNVLAQLLASSPDPAYRDGPKAVATAQRACELSEWKNWTSLATLAAAYAESGDFENAVKWVNQALELAPSGMKAELQDQLYLYRQEKPYRVPST